MEEETVPAQSSVPARAPRAGARSRRWRALAVILVAIGVGVALYFALRNRNSESPGAANATAATGAELTQLARSVRHPIFWVGARPGFTYELSRQPGGTINVRYLPAGEKVGTSKPFLSVATYPFVNAYGALKGIKAKNVVFLKLPKGGIAEYSKAYPQSVHAAYPGVNYQVELYDPSPGAAIALAQAGQLQWIGRLTEGSQTQTTTTTTSAPAKPEAATVAQLRTAATALKHPIYWAGPKGNVTYELLQTSDGRVYIRYLPSGVAVGSKKPYLSVATYPFPKALAAIKKLANSPNTERIDVPGGGIAIVDKSYPQSIHLAFPGSDFQIEVYDPSAARARSVVTSGSVQSIG